MIKGLLEVKERIDAAQVARDKVITQGRRAYRMGIEKRDNPLNTPSDRKLWEHGFDLERESFGTMLTRWKG